MDIRILDLKKEQAGHGAIKLRAQLSFGRQNADHDWVTVVEGQGPNLAAAAESLARNDKFVRVMANHLTTGLKEMTAGEPKETTGPKSTEPSGQSQPEGHDPSSSKPNPESATQKPAIATPPHTSRGAAPPTTASAPKTQQVKGSSTQGGTRPGKKLSQEEVEVTEF